ncbi:unnamed protein product [Lactuca virosa]|uniref:DUF4220 domain-containing protein n=1 Tax=Lactuca virosa TaxID=75947 RepID=A0AAU9NW47_9ASTR|nr:unnamed protein product [Lactuca virosa]
MTWTSPTDAVPWVGLYICAASLVCTLAMAADVYRGFRQRKLWFPCRFFTINSVSITLIAISTKLPVDLSSALKGHEIEAKFVSITFLVIMLANFLPSLGLMNDKELLLNTVALCILMLTITVNMLIQVISASASLSIATIILLFILPIPWPISVALTVSASRRVLQQRYKELHILASNHQDINFSSKRLICYVKKVLDDGRDWFTEEPNASDCNAISEMEEYSGYVLQIDPDAKLSMRILRNALNSITRLLRESEKKESRNLMKLLEKSTGFNGVVEFDNEQVPPLHLEETQNCWSLVAVTLTAIALALPKIATCHVKGLLSSMREGLQFVRHMEESLNANGELVKARKAARRVWTDVEVYCKWLQIDLQKNARNGKTSKEILQWLGDEAAKIVIQFNIRKNVSLDHSLRKFIAASSMYRISQTILLHCNEQENWPTDEALFEFISTIIADLLCACFTSLPRVITTNCHEDAIEKREESIRIAAQLLGRSKKILKLLKKRQLPNIDMESMGYIDKWHALSKSQIPNGNSARIQPASSSSNASFVVTII